MPATSHSPSPAQMRIFLVDNDIRTLDVMRQHLETMGHQVITADNMEGALNGIPATEFDVLMSDIGLPDGNGWELLRKVQKPKPFYAIAMSGYGSPADIRASAAVGYRDHLVKPLTREKLQEALQKASTEKGL
jgi:CheY-like chemotaxis protein